MKIIVWCLCMLFSIHAFADGEEGAKVGDQSPDFEYEDKDGKIYSLKDRKWLSFVHYYQVTTIPRYILLDKEGKVVHLDMPRPSNPEFEKILKSLKGL